MNKIFKSKKVSIMMMIVLVLSQFSGVSFAEEVDDNLLSKTVTVMQNNVIIPESDWSNIDIEDEVDLSFSVDVPVIGDGGAVGTYVNYNDTASFIIAKGFTMADVSYELTAGNPETKVATLNIVNDEATKTITANIVFDGAESIFNGDGGWIDVNIKFNANMKYERDESNIEGGTETLEFLDKTFELSVPPLPTVIEGEKTGVRDGQFIDWTVRVEGTKGSSEVDLEGYVFKDDFTNVGEYVPDSFKVQTTSPAAITADPSIDPDFSEDGSELSYTFPNGSTGEQYIFFRTEIEDSIFMSNGSKTISNTGKLYNTTDADSVWTDVAPVDFTVNWIEKEGAVTSFNAETNSGEMTWTITANQLGSSLTNAVITDVLDDKLDFDSAEWLIKTGGVWVSQGAIVPTESNSEYNFGDISTPIMLKILTKIKDGVDIGHTVQNIKNSATISWDGYTGDGIGIGTGNIGVNIGLNPIDKTVGSYDRSTHTIPWNIEVKKSNVDDDLRVMDLLVYANSGFDVNDIGSAYTIVDNADSGLNAVSDTDFKSLVPSFNQKYNLDTFATTSSALQVKVYTVKNTSDEAVADLLVVTGKGSSDEVEGIDVSLASQSFSFETIVTNPDIYAKNGNTRIKNSTSLFSANELINKDSASVNYDSTILVKDMLTRENASDPDANKNSSAADVTTGFNYEDKTVVYRLHVNGNNLTDFANDITTVDGTLVGAITLEDTLPEGWEFINIGSDEMFKIYEGSGNSDGTVTAGDVPSDLSFMTSDFSVTGKATFEFSNITKPYVILLKAKPNDETIASYFDANVTNNPINSATINATNWASGSSDFEDVTIISEVLGKSFNNDDGVLTWTVEYKPYGLSHTGIQMEDTISQGIELRTDAEGVLDLSDDNFVVTKLTLKTDGTYEDSDNVILDQGVDGNLSYDSTSRLLTFVIPQDQTDIGYRIVYKTDITGDATSTITNSVKLIGSGVTSDSVDKSYVVQTSDASATMTRSGWIEITKKDGSDGTSLSGASFEVRTASGNVFRLGITGEDGKLILRGLPVGDYTLHETIAPEGYNLENRTYDISVSEESGTFGTTITGFESNEIIIENVKAGTEGTLKISKILTGNATSTTKDFEFTINVDSINGTYNYEGDGGKVDGSLEFVEGAATLTLKGGESASILKLPKGANYTVVESDYSADGYTTTKTGDTGSIEADTVLEVIYTNRRNISSTTTPTPTPTPTPEVTPTPIPTPTVIEEITTPEIPVKDIIEVPEESTIEVEQIPENGTVIVDDKGNWEYTPDPEFTGKDSFVIVVTDPEGNEEEFFIDIFVEELPEGVIELPATGGINREWFNLFGLGFIGFGLLLFKKRN